MQVKELDRLNCRDLKLPIVGGGLYLWQLRCHHTYRNDFIGELITCLYMKPPTQTRMHLHSSCRSVCNLRPSHLVIPWDKEAARERKVYLTARSFWQIPRVFLLIRGNLWKAWHWVFGHRVSRDWELHSSLHYYHLYTISTTSSHLTNKSRQIIIDTSSSVAKTYTVHTIHITYTILLIETALFPTLWHHQCHQH